MYVTVKNVAIWILCAICMGSAVNFEQRTYFVIERLRTTYINPKYISEWVVTSRRYTRRDTAEYITMHYNSLFTVDNNTTYHIYFLEFLSNEYKRSFVELHLRACDAINSDPITSYSVQKVLNRTCPLPPGEYYFNNFTFYVPVVKNFPFKKGRIAINATYGVKRERIVEGHADFQVKQIKGKQL